MKVAGRRKNLRINELAKEIGKTNKEIIEFLQKNGVEVTSHANKISDEVAQKVRDAFFINVDSDGDKKEEPQKKKLTAVFRPQNAQQKSKSKHEDNKGEKQVHIEKKEKNIEKVINKETVIEKATGNEKINKETISEEKMSNIKEQNIEKEIKIEKKEEETKDVLKSEQVSDGLPKIIRNIYKDEANKKLSEARKATSERKNATSGFKKNTMDNRVNKGFKNNDNKFTDKNNSANPNNKKSFANTNSENNNGFRNNKDKNFRTNKGDNKNNQANKPFNKDNRGFNKDRKSNFAFVDKDKDDMPRNNQRQSTKKDNKSSVSNLDGALVKKTSSTRPNKNNFKYQKNDKKHRTEDGPVKGKVSKHPFIMPVKKVEEVVVDDIKEIIIPERMTIKDFAAKLKLQPSVIVKKLFLKGEIVTINTELSFSELEEIALEYDIICTLEEKVDVIAELLKEDDEDEKDMVKRPPVVCVMGHVDHGKTSLLDAIRKADVSSHEAGGITQHIGAYMVKINGEYITFLDTPGHEAFTAMRMRGAQSTDIAILVVAADDGVMPQTIEAINHAKAAGVEIIVAINKIDKPSANIDRVKQELSEYELIAEDWGGNTIFCPVSAKTKEGIENLLEMILLAAEVKELKANKKRKARGLVIEAELDKGRGPVATVLVQKGTLKVGDFVAAGACHGKVRAMINDKGQRVKEATPSTPVEILGLDNVPNAGEVFVATNSDKEAKDFAATFISENKNKLIEDTKAKLSLDDLFSQIKAGNIKELPIIIKADVQGSVEAVKQSLLKLSNEEVAIKVIHGGVGAINESDVALAAASNAIIIGFNIRPDATAKVSAEREKVDLRLYKVIYQAIEDVQAAMNGMLEPIYEEQVIGHAEIRQIFKASGLGNIAGSYVLDGKFVRNCKVRIKREGNLVFEGDLASLKRFKDDVKEVKEGYECGLVFEKFNDIKELDIVEAYIMVEVPR